MTGGLAASNIAWSPSEDEAAAEILRARGFTGVEVAPGKRWEKPMEATATDIAAYRGSWEKRGLRVVAMQSLLFGRPDLQLFGPAEARRALAEYLTSIVDIAYGLGAQALVFGSPRNRKRDAMPLDEALGIAEEFFRELGAVAVARNCVICIEPNPPDYGCDFITTTAEAVALCQRIGSRGVRVNGDAGTLALCGEDPSSTIAAAAPWLGHYHASEPNLVPLSASEVHQAAAGALAAARYEGWVSVEMRETQQGDNLRSLARAADHARHIYGSRG